jgi:predicted enzyme related to lactoylglutathione lyase
MIEVLGVDNVLHAVGDFRKAKDFYGTRLGLPLKFEVREAGIALYRLGSEEAGLLTRVQTIGAPRVWLEVPDARAAARELGLEATEINTGWVVEVDDPWGNVIGFTDYVNRPELGRRR